MKDSCNPRKLVPGLAQRYSNPRLLITSTMKSAPTCCPGARTSAELGGSVSACADIGGTPVACWLVLEGAISASRGAVSAAAHIAAPFRKLRRSTDSLVRLVTCRLLYLTANLASGTNGYRSPDEFEPQRTLPQV